MKTENITGVRVNSPCKFMPSLIYLFAVPILMLYCKWASQITTTLPGLPEPASESFTEILLNNYDTILVSVICSFPVYCFTLSFAHKLLLKGSYLHRALFAVNLIVYWLIILYLFMLIFPMYFFFGVPYSVKVLLPSIILSVFGGVVFSLKQKFALMQQSVK